MNFHSLDRQTMYLVWFLGISALALTQSWLRLGALSWNSGQCISDSFGYLYRYWTESGAKMLVRLYLWNVDPSRRHGVRSNLILRRKSSPYQILKVPQDLYSSLADYLTSLLPYFCLDSTDRHLSSISARKLKSLQDLHSIPKAVLGCCSIEQGLQFGPFSTHLQKLR